MRKFSIILSFLLLSISLIAKNDTLVSKKIIYKFDIKEQIAKPVWRTTQQSISEAIDQKADLILIHMNTYGGAVDAADSIRTKILNCPIPVYVFVDNNAASAGALISIACDSIYMRPGGSIGAATVVNQTGEQVPDKYQSFMRSLMRATAEAHGKDTIINGNDTIIKWHRDPKIAEAMVDPKLEVKGISDTGQVLTFTTEEAIKHGFCEGSADNIKDVIAHLGITDYEIVEYKHTFTEKIIQLLVNPAVSGILIMVIIGGLYFELQSPGIGFPIAAAAIAAVLYFAPLYLEGLANNWELAVFIVGVILMIVEIFAIPGFGFFGFAGIIFMVAGLSMAMVDNIVFTFDPKAGMNALAKSLAIVLGSLIGAILLSIVLGKRAMKNGFISRLVLETSENRTEGYLSTNPEIANVIGKTGEAYTILRPSGKVLIDGEIYDANSEIGFIEKGESIKVIRFESGQVYVMKNS